MDDHSTAAPQIDTSELDNARDDGEAGLVEDVLVEEVSIDGMCGVY